MPRASIINTGRAGVMRDQTEFADAGFSTSTQWCRFQNGLPEKMGGIEALGAAAHTGVDNARGNMSILFRDGFMYITVGSLDGTLRTVKLSSSSYAPVSNDVRTPLGLVSAGTKGSWQIDNYYDSTAGAIRTVAHYGSYGLDIADSTDTDIYYRAATSPAIFQSDPANIPKVSGGIVSLQPYMVGYGNDGFVTWSPSNGLNSSPWQTANVTSQKIVKGLPLRSGGGPAALLWSLDSIIRMSFIGGAPTWQFDTISTQSSILSPHAIIEYDGTYFWPGLGRFLSFNGYLKELPNPLCTQYFFDTLGPKQSYPSVFAFKVPEKGEIWWCYPASTQPYFPASHAIVYNVRDNTWYPTELPVTFAAALSPFYRNHPIVAAGVDLPGSAGNHPFLLMETFGGGLTNPDGSVSPIAAHYETPRISAARLLSGGLNESEDNTNKLSTNSVRISALEMDIGSTATPPYGQDGPLSVTITDRRNPSAALTTVASFTLPYPPSVQVQGIRADGRNMRIRFSSNDAEARWKIGGGWITYDITGGREKL